MKNFNHYTAQIISQQKRFIIPKRNYRYNIINKFNISIKIDISIAENMNISRRKTVIIL